jgi:hypothetical protein
MIESGCKEQLRLMPATRWSSLNEYLQDILQPSMGNDQEDAME